MAKKPLRADKVGAHNTQYLKNKKKLMKVTEVCALCGKLLNYNISFPHPLAPVCDHVISISKGGHASSIDNLQIVHNICNNQKGSKLLMNNKVTASDSASEGDPNRNLPWSMDWTTYKGND